MRTIRYTILLCAFALQGCGTVANMADKDTTPYGGVKKAASGFTGSCHSFDCAGKVFSQVFAIIDIPLSIVFDTVTLPYTIPYAISNANDERRFSGRYVNAKKGGCIFDLDLKSRDKAHLSISKNKKLQCKPAHSGRDCADLNGSWRIIDDELAYFPSGGSGDAYRFSFNDEDTSLTYIGNKSTRNNKPLKMSRQCATKTLLKRIEKYN